VTEPASQAEQVMEVLVVDDEADIRALAVRALTRNGCKVEPVPNAVEALALLTRGRTFDVIVTDLSMPGLSGTEFLRQIRQIDLDVPVIVITGNPTVESAVAIIEYGGFRYLQKPIDVELLRYAVLSAGAMHRLAVLKRRALELSEGDGWLIGDRAGLDARFDRALERLWIAFQPIVRWSDRVVFGYEALVRSDEPTLSSPGLLFDAAERLGRVREVGRGVRRAVAEAAPLAPPETMLFVNLHAADLNDDTLYAATAPLTSFASKVVLEITERTSLSRVNDVRACIARLRDLGFRIAVDDLGAGYAGLSSFSQLEPDVAKLDMSLVRGIDTSPRKASIVRSMLTVCQRELGTYVVCEGVETEAERDTLMELGADLLQGYLFARPQRGFCDKSLFAPAL
jgi:EAL domain-containing protein (putative c-di-GMP-specific phosphodiesterase class I)/ActR/RegA family two-component response regulator